MRRSRCRASTVKRRVKIPESTQTGTTFRLRGKGMPDVSGRGRGDLLVTVQAITPKKLTKEQKKLLEQLAATLPEQKVKPKERDDEDDDRGIFGKVKDIFGYESQLARPRPARERRSTTPKISSQPSSPTSLPSPFTISPSGRCRPAGCGIRRIRRSPIRRRLPCTGTSASTMPASAIAPPRRFIDAIPRPDRSSRVDLPDEDWAARSQQSLTAVHAGAFIVAPPWDLPADPGDATVIVIEPSMGFGTGHHATTRMCLRLLSDDRRHRSDRARSRHRIRRVVDGRGPDAARAASSASMSTRTRSIPRRRARG